MVSQNIFVGIFAEGIYDIFLQMEEELSVAQLSLRLASSW